MRRLALGTPASGVLVPATLLFGFAGLPQPAQAQAPAGASTTTGVSRAFNPAISLNGLFLGTLITGLDEHEEASEQMLAQEHDHEHGHAEEGISVQEIELRFTSTIDPYSKADATIAYHDGEFHFEEAVVSSSALPWGFGLRAGLTYVPLSRENILHTHQLPFVRRSLVLSSMFEEGYTDVGLELNYIFALPFYVELRGAAFDGRDETWFGSENGRDLAYLGALDALWDLGESTTFRVHGGYLAGRNAVGTSTISQLASGGVELQWRPVRRALYRGLKIAGEYTHGDRQSDDPVDRLWTGGWNAYVQYQFARRWWIQGRYDWNDPSDEAHSQRASAMMAFVPSEFQSLRLEYSYNSTPEDDFAEIFLQYNFTIGSHPAHLY